jgi:type I restriction enzyme S subunit
MRQINEPHSTLPNGWISEKLGSLADKITKGATPTTYGYVFQRSGINFIKIQNVFSGAINLNSITDFISDEAHQNQRKSILKIDDVLFSIAGTIGETSIVKAQHLPANTNQAFAIISGFSDLLLPKYLEFQLRSFVSQKTKEKARGGAMNNVSLDDLKHLELLLPPLLEQHRIVAKIEALFSELDNGIASLKTARHQLKIYRQALLKHAFSGKLTEQWRVENQDKLETAEVLLQRIQTEREQCYQQQFNDWEAKGKQGSKPKVPKLLMPLTAEELGEFPELPIGWAWIRLADVSTVTGGLTKNGKRSDLPIKRPFLRVGNVYANRLELDEMHLIGISEAEINRVELIKNDILIVEGNGSADQIGRAAIWNGAIAGCVHQNHLIKARPLNLVTSEFILYFLMSELGRKFIVRSASSTSGLYTLNITKIENLFIPFCISDEQNILINELAVKFSLVDQFDQTLTTALQQAEALRQSILKKAFSGQLVPQDSNDEPASVLLERIQAEKVKSITLAPVSRGKKTVTKHRSPSC